MDRYFEEMVEKAEKAGFCPECGCVVEEDNDDLFFVRNPVEKWGSISHKLVCDSCGDRDDDVCPDCDLRYCECDEYDYD